MKFNLNDLRKLVKEEMNRRAVLNEGLFGGPGSTGLEVMPPEVTQHLPNPDSKASQERKLQQMAKPDLSKFAIEFAREINKLGDKEEEKLKFKLKKFINTMMLKLFGKDITFKNLEEGTENLQVVKAIIELIQIYMSSSPDELESFVAKLIDILDKNGKVEIANKIGEIYRKYFANFYRDEGEGNPNIVNPEDNV